MVVRCDVDIDLEAVELALHAGVKFNLAEHQNVALMLSKMHEKQCVSVYVINIGILVRPLIARVTASSSFRDML